MKASIKKSIIEAIQAIAKDDPEIRSALKHLRDRGVLPAVSTTVVGGEVLNCCEKDDKQFSDEEEDSGDGNDGTIDGERPDDGQNEKNMDGRFRGPDGELFDWDDGYCEPDPLWQDGYYWISGNYGSSSGPGGIAAKMISSSNAFAHNLNPEQYGACSYGNTNYIPLSSDSGGNVDRYEIRAYSNGSCPFIYVSTNVTRIGCSAEDYVNGVCTLEAPCDEEDEWPADGKCQEALINGKFIPHPNDPDCAGRGPQDYQIMCDSSKCIAYIPTKDGGHMRVEVDPVTRLPVAGSDMTFYGSDGKPKSSTEYRYDNVKYNAYGPNSVPGNWGE